MFLCDFDRGLQYLRRYLPRFSLQSFQELLIYFDLDLAVFLIRVLVDRESIGVETQIVLYVLIKEGADELSCEVRRSAGCRDRHRQLSFCRHTHSRKRRNSGKSNGVAGAFFTQGSIRVEI